MNGLDNLRCLILNAHVEHFLHEAAVLFEPVFSRFRHFSLDFVAVWRLADDYREFVSARHVNHPLIREGQHWRHCCSSHWIPVAQAAEIPITVRE